MKQFGRFWYDFVVGDDWRVAAGVIAAVSITAALAHNGVTAWWILPLATAGVLALAVRR